jgi:2-desacetyl-2-hydroxyethyl bacteriochlorophyllide A dehydrogenase
VIVGTAVWFDEPRRVAVREEQVERPGPGQVLIRAICSLISQGTEMLVYNGLVPPDTPLTLPTSRGSFAFPVKYAYQVVGEVVEAGAGVPFAPGAVVFARHPHQSYFTMEYTDRHLFAVPAGLRPEQAAFANLCEVSLNALLDRPVRIGDVAVVRGQGIVGRLCARLAARTALTVVVVDPVTARRDAEAATAGVVAATPETVGSVVDAVSDGRGADAVFEASGQPAALQQAMSLTAPDGSIVAVSYYGTRPVTLRLSPEFHFRRYRLISSQSGAIPADLRPRWDFPRRMAVAMSLLPDLDVERMVSHRLPVSRAREAYDLLDSGAPDVTGVLLEYR